jgi:O-antigen/teichoic acid export membrane protein
VIHILTAIFRGLNRVKEKVIFVDSTRNLLFLLFLSVIIWSGLSFEDATIAYSSSIIITAVFFVLYFVIQQRISHHKLNKNNIDISIGKELLLFSLPLLIVIILYQIMGWTDTLMLGYFKTADTVGVYNAAAPLGKFVSAALTSMIFVYMPVVSGLYAKNKIDKMKKSYAVLTKWLCAATLPLVMVFVFFPDVVLTFLFGPKYTSAGTALQILAFGFFINNLLGPNGATLTAMGKIRLLMYATFASACINVILNALLIPKYGVNGSALATITALVSINIIRSIKLYSLSKIHSLEKNILKPIILSGILVVTTYFIAKIFLTITFWILPLLFIIFIVLYGFSLLLTKSFDKEDIELLLLMEKKLGINLKILKRMLNRFV